MEMYAAPKCLSEYEAGLLLKSVRDSRSACRDGMLIQFVRHGLRLAECLSVNCGDIRDAHKLM